MPEHLSDEEFPQSLPPQIVADLHFDDPRGRRAPPPTVVGHFPEQTLGSRLSGAPVVQSKLEWLQWTQDTFPPPRSQPRLRQRLRLVLLAQRAEPGIDDIKRRVEPAVEDEHAAVRFVPVGAKERLGVWIA